MEWVLITIYVIFLILHCYILLIGNKKNEKTKKVLNIRKIKNMQRIDDLTKLKEVLVDGFKEVKGVDAVFIGPDKSVHVVGKEHDTIGERSPT